MSPDEDAIRILAFLFLDEARRRHGEALPRRLLEQGFQFEGRRVPLVGPPGIFKPAALSLPISITTIPVVEGKVRPYDDAIRGDGLIAYRYRGSDPHHPDNSGLRSAMHRQVPLIYFYGLVEGRYAAVYPVLIVGDDPTALTFTVAADELPGVIPKYASQVAEEADSARRAYITRTVQQRLHQEGFRARVLAAYGECCAACRLRHHPLLDAAHILPDGHPKGEPWVSNGLALCKLHHAAFDSNLMGVRPDLIVEIREDILTEEDGPLLTHGLQELHGRRLLVIPSKKSQRPREDYLEERYNSFKRTG